MDFPTWALLGIGLFSVLAILLIVRAQLIAPPQTGREENTRTRSRIYRGYALACALMALGFFVAGVPLGNSSEEEEAMADIVEAMASPSPPTQTELGDSLSFDELTELMASPTPTRRPTPTSILAQQENGNSSTTGSFSSADNTETEDDAVENESSDSGAFSDDLQATTPPDTPQPTETPSPTATATPTLVPTHTPLPTLTPTPIVGETAVVDTNGSTLWVFRTPGGQPFVVANDGDTLILGSGHASKGGDIWQEVFTVNGLHGWVQAEFLTYTDESEAQDAAE